MSENTLNLNHVHEVAETAARKAGVRIADALSTGKEIEVQHKGIRDLVTEIDVWAEKEITKAVLAEFPDHVILGEESASDLARKSGKTLQDISRHGTCWVVDPLDGTTNFVNRLPHVSVSIGVLQQGKRVFGLIYDPCRNELFTARRSQGAQLNGCTIHVSAKVSLIDTVVSTGFAGDESEKWSLYSKTCEAAILNCHKVRVFGSAALDLSWVACGRLDGYYQYGLKPWDVAAGSLIVEEAGGQIGCFVEQGGEYSIFASSVLASNAAIFVQLQQLLHRADKEGRHLIS
jgi:myo-inositol-1(or 4)-monophosphatase